MFIQNFLTFLVQNERAFFIVTAMVTITFTAVNLYFSRRKVVDDFRAKQKDFEPDVYTYFDRQDFNYYLVIENIGSKDAFDIKLEYPEEFLSILKLIKDYQQDLQILINGIDYLAPKGKLQIFLVNKVSIGKIFNICKNSKYKVKTIFHNKRMHKFENDNLLDFSIIRSLTKKNIHDPMEEINQTLKQTNFELNQIVEVLKSYHQDFRNIKQQNPNQEFDSE